MRATGGEFHTPHNRRRILFTLTEAMYCRKSSNFASFLSLTRSKLIFQFSFFQRENGSFRERERKSACLKAKSVCALISVREPTATRNLFYGRHKTFELLFHAIYCCNFIVCLVINILCHTSFMTLLFSILTYTLMRVHVMIIKLRQK